MSDAHQAQQDAHSLSWTLLSLARLTTERTRDDMPVGAVVVLYWLRRLGPSRVTDVAEVVALDASTVSRRISGLQDAGLVARVNDPADARAWLVEITEAGAQRLALFEQHRREALEELVSAWDPEDLTTFTQLATRLHDSVEQSVRSQRRGAQR